MEDRRFPFIPPRKRKPYPAVRPLTLVELLDPDGYRYRGVVDGKSVEVFSVPGEGGETYELGEVVAARIVSGSGELFLPAPYSAEIIYFSPGGLWPGAWADWHGELWKYDGVDPPEHVWTPTYLLYEHPTCLAWYAGTGRLYIWTWGIHPVSSNAIHRIYKLNPADDSIILVLEHDQNADGGWQETPMDVAQATFGGIDYLFVHFGWYSGFGDSRIIRFDPSAETELTVFVYPSGGGLSAYTGGICYHPSSGRLLGFSGYQMYRSLDGLAWVLDNDLYANFDVYDSGPMVLNPDDGNIYLAVEYYKDPPGPPFNGQGGVMKYDGVNWTIDHQYPGIGNGNVGFKPIGNLYKANGDIETVAGYWAWWYGLDRAEVHKKTAGIWGMDWVGPPLGEGWVHTACQTLVTLNGQLLVLMLDMTAGLPVYGARLYERDLVGAYSAVMNWASYRCWITYIYTQCMTLARTSKLIHEI